jgi:hypothetical protein
VQIGGRALGDLLRLPGRASSAEPVLGIVVRATRDVQGSRTRLRLVPHDVLDVLRIGSLAELGLRDDVLVAAAKRIARIREKDRADQVQVRGRVAQRVAVACPAALAGLLAIGLVTDR